jgi:GTP-binding protein HflX
LLAEIDQRLAEESCVVDLDLDPADGARLAWLYRHGTVLERREDDGRVHVRVALSTAEQARLGRDSDGPSAGCGDRKNSGPPR